MKGGEGNVGGGRGRERGRGEGVIGEERRVGGERKSKKKEKC